MLEGPARALLDGVSERIRIGIIGLNRGLAHARALAQLEGIELAAIADTDEARRAEATKRFPEARCFEDAEALLASGELDAVVVATPTHLREKHVCAAFDAGLHALAESPVGRNGRDASHIVTAAGLVGRTFMWSNPLRFDSRLQVARQSVEAGELGELLKASASVKAELGACAPDSWRLDRDRGGGALLECGSGAIDALWHAIGCPEPMEAMAASYGLSTASFAEGIEKTAEDSLAGMVRFKNGSCLQVWVDAILPGGVPPALAGATRLVLQGSKGDAVLDFGEANASDENELLLEQARAFARAIRQGTEPPNPGKQALSLGKMLDALSESAREKSAVSIKVERTLDDLFGGL